MLLLNESNEKFREDFISQAKAIFNGDMSENEIKSLQNNKLQDVLSYVYDNSNFYKNRLAPYADKFSDYTKDNFQEIPFTTKDDLRESGLDILSKPIEEQAYFYETTGTTGSATPCPRNMVDIISSNITISLSYKHIFESLFPNKKPVIGVFGPTELHSFGDTLGNVALNLDFCVVKAWPYSPMIGFEKTLEVMQKLQIDVIMCTPGLSMTLLKAAQKHGYDLQKDFNVKMLMLTGEMCTEPMAKNIEALWGGACVYNFLYGSQEALVISTCDINNEMRIFPHNYIYEIVDPSTGDYKGNYGTGELVLTMLNPGGKPLIRYKTGDLVTIKKPEDKSPIPTPVIEIKGRVKDQILLNSSAYKASDFEEGIMKNISGCLGYQIFIDNLNGLDELQIDLEMSGSLSESEEKENAKKIQNYFYDQHNLKVTVCFTDELSNIVYTGALVSWKAARIVDRRKNDSSDIEQKSAQKAIDDSFIRSE